MAPRVFRFERPRWVIVTPVFLFILMRLCRISVRDLIAAVAPSALTSAAVIAGVALFRQLGWL